MLGGALRVFVAFALFAGTIAAQDRMPTRVVSLDYPPLAVAAMVSGIVKVKCVVDSAGQVQSAELAELSRRTTTGELLGRLAVENALQWRFAQSESKSTELIIEYRFEFELNKPSQRRYVVFDLPRSVRVVAEIPPPQR